MSIPFFGTRTRSQGVISSIAKHLRTLSLKPVKSIQIQFDPFHETAGETRNFFFHITTPKIIATNPRCSIKPKIVSDLSDPVITLQLLSGDKVIFKSAHLTAQNILELYNKHITTQIPVESDPNQIEVVQKKKKKLKIKPGRKKKGVFV